MTVSFAAAYVPGVCSRVELKFPTYFSPLKGILLADEALALLIVELEMFVWYLRFYLLIDLNLSSPWLLFKNSS